MNQKLLQEYNVDLTEGASVKAGDVLTVATPFVSVLSTSSRGIRCENCYLKKNVKLFCDRLESKISIQRDTLRLRYNPIITIFA